MPGRPRPELRKPYNVDPKVAHERAILAARARNSPDSYIKSLAAAELTREQKRRLAVLLMPFLLGDEDEAEGAA